VLKLRALKKRVERSGRNAMFIAETIEERAGAASQSVRFDLPLLLNKVDLNE
jgi:hypothetical protein